MCYRFVMLARNAFDKEIFTSGVNSSAEEQYF